MPRTNGRYHLGKIFGIYNKDDILIYIGITTINLKDHLHDITTRRIFQIPPDLRSAIASYAYRDNFANGWTIEEYPCDERWKLEGMAQILINQYKPFVNMQMRAAIRFKENTKISRLTLECPYCIANEETNEEPKSLYN